MKEFTVIKYKPKFYVDGFDAKEHGLPKRNSYK
jgi:hypothetical protein